MAPSSRSRFLAVPAAALVFGACAIPAHASALATLAAPACTTGSNDLTCRLHGVLHVLYIIAAVLALVLIAVVALAFHIYRKNSVQDEQRRP